MYKTKNGEEKKNTKPQTSTWNDLTNYLIAQIVLTIPSIFMEWAEETAKTLLG